MFSIRTMRQFSTLGCLLAFLIIASEVGGGDGNGKSPVTARGEKTSGNDGN